MHDFTYHFYLQINKWPFTPKRTTQKHPGNEGNTFFVAPIHKSNQSLYIKVQGLQIRL